ncbi:MAG: phosphotransferase [Deltaproteobacteria bacterium]|nr:phosphotransferase [Deltaproteobacteria bacterium]
MKAMVLAAGFGSRLMPYTKHTPKPLFTIAGKTVLDTTIRRLVRAGASAVVVNTHHLHAMVENYLAAADYGIPVVTSHERRILGTGGALKNVSHFWDDAPFMVVNGDIYTDIDLRAVYRFHCNHTGPVTLVLCDDPAFNQVALHENGTVFDFQKREPGADTWTFTGIHVIDPRVLDLIPSGCFTSIIDTYRLLIERGEAVHTYIPGHVQWDDVGTLDRYSRVARREMWKKAFRLVYPGTPTQNGYMTRLSGDGSDRKWYRIACENRTMIMVDHGLRCGGHTSEADAFVFIGRHLRNNNVAVPEIYYADTFAGLVCLEDLGDLHLQEAVHRAASDKAVICLYRKVVTALIRMSVSGGEGFDPSWAWQTPSYDRQLILDRECRYFVECFLNLYLGMDVAYVALAEDFDCLAKETVNNAFTGFMHRDFQSRNIMLRAGEPLFIDFQGGRLGPLQYDLASLLIDPYTALPPRIQETLLSFAMQRLSRDRDMEPGRFMQGYACCCITRNLQALGAFGHLSKNRGKSDFATYIPTALDTLKHNLEKYFPGEKLERLKQAVQQASHKLSAAREGG